MCRLLNCDEPRADSFAIDLGIAMQLTNISRDVLEDAKMNRRYLPASWTNATPEQIAAADVDCQQQVAQAISRLLDLSEHYYASAQLGIRLLPFRSRLSIAIALRVYRQIGRVLKRRKMVWWRERVMVTSSEKVWLSLRSMGDLWPKKVPPHQAQLHQHLQGLAGVQPR
jgi:phytoene synthase